MEKMPRVQINQGAFKASEVWAKRKGAYGGPLNRRNQATVEQIDEWIAHYVKLIEDGKFCPIRGRKIVEKFWKMREKKNDRLERDNSRKDKNRNDERGSQNDIGGSD